MGQYKSVKLKGGWSADRELFSPTARELAALLLADRRALVMLPDDAVRGTRFHDDGTVLVRLESMFDEAQFMLDPCPGIDAALVDAAQSDHWYKYSKDYGTNEEDDSYETEIV